jgi:glycogen operon protein
MGANVASGGANFAILSPLATHATLVLYRDAEDVEPLFTAVLDPTINRTGDYWHVFVRNARPGLYYTWRLDGPRAPEQGTSFDPDRELLDPCAKAVSAKHWNRLRARSARAARKPHFRARIVGAERYDWEGDEPLRRSLQDAVIYELHVGSFTRHPSARVRAPGTFAGIVEKIPYLKSLGVTDIELLPVAAFDAQDVPASAAALRLENYWGYSPVAFFAVHSPFAHGDARNEFRDMVKALHRAGIGVILDVVLNHTAEGGEDGVTIGFKGLGNEFFYHLDARDRRRYLDYTGCGNTVNCNHPSVVAYLLECLEYWVLEMHVDGFRFDLASVMTRGENGRPLERPPLLAAIESSPALARTHLIAEAWDAGGLYQVGGFPGLRWAEWNGLYRDSLRRFVRGEPGLIGEVATRIAGSSDLYARQGKSPANSINFVTCHDGFTLCDLVSYEAKHNEANGEQNRDGTEQDFSANCGVEGPTADAGVLRLREQRARNFLTLLMLSQGVPMLLAGDETLRSQRGNNNAYCQNNEISWLDWAATETRSGMLRFTRAIIALRARHPTLRRARFIEASPGEESALRWCGVDGRSPDWSDGAARVLCFTLDGVSADEAPLHVMANMGEEAVAAQVPEPPAGRRWHRIVDTARASPDDVVDAAAGVPLEGPTYRLLGDSVVVLEAVLGRRPTPGRVRKAGALRLRHPRAPTKGTLANYPSGVDARGTRRRPQPYAPAPGSACELAGRENERTDGVVAAADSMVVLGAL